MRRIMSAHRPYPGLPPLAGVAGFADAAKPGLSVEQCVGRLKRYHYLLKRLHQIFNNHITAEPIYELKMGFSLHAHYCAEHTTALSVTDAEFAGARQFEIVDLRHEIRVPPQTEPFEKQTTALVVKVLLPEIGTRKE